MSATTVCVHCLKRPAKGWTGHVLRPWGKRLRMVTAGWCSTRCRDAAGFVGHWRPEMNPEKPPQPTGDGGRETR